MKYRELLVEYKGLLDRDIALRMELHAIPKGYLVTKKISGKEYLYLQYSAQGKKKSEYIRDEEAVSVRAAIARREPVKAEMDEIHLEQLLATLGTIQHLQVGFCLREQHKKLHRKHSTIRYLLV